MSPCRSWHTLIFTSKSLQAKLVEITPFFIKSNSNSGCLYAKWTRSFAILQSKKSCKLVSLKEIGQISVKTVLTKTGQHANSSYSMYGYSSLVWFDYWLLVFGRETSFPNSLTAYLSFLLRKTAPLTKLKQQAPLKSRNLKDRMVKITFWHGLRFFSDQKYKNINLFPSVKSK